MHIIVTRIPLYNYSSTSFKPLFLFYDTMIYNINAAVSLELKVALQGERKLQKLYDTDTN